MKVIIAGGRDFQDRSALEAAIRASGFAISEVVTGGARGADTLGFDWAWSNSIPVRTFLPDWKQHGRAAGPIRNQQMAEYAEALVAMPGGRGTADMLARAKAHGLQIFTASLSPSPRKATGDSE